ncbi:hypothetical protein IAT38_003087 [Cryptococcus sp. DSM 104549]
MGFVARGGKEVWRRSGLANIIGGGPDTAPKLDAVDRTPRRRSTGDSSASSTSHSTSSGSTPSSAIAQRLRAQPLDTSSILYPTLTAHPSSDAHHILVVSLAHISSAPPTLSNEDLFQIILRRLEPWVGEEGEGGYVLVIFADEGGVPPKGSTDSEDGEKRPAAKAKAEPQQRKLPGVAWWVWRWKRIPRKYRKNLKRFYIVHPSLFTRTLLPFILPFVSPKSYSKLHPLPSLLSLYHAHHVPLKGIDISLPVLEAEARVLRDRPDLLPPLPDAPPRPAYPAARPPMNRAPSSESSLASWGYQTLTSAVGTAASYLPNIGGFRSVNGEDGAEDGQAGSVVTAGYWRRDLASLVEECGGKVPPLFVELRKAILAECTRTEGVFRRSSNSHLQQTLTAILALPLDAQPNLPWGEIAAQDPLLPAKMLCKVLGELAVPVIRPGLYPLVRSITEPSDITERFLPALPPSYRDTLAYIIHMLHHLAAFEPATKMSPLNLAIVLAPALIAGPDPLEDAGMCLAQGKKLPGAMLARRAAAGGEGEGEKEVEGDGTVVGVLEMWIWHYPSLASSPTAPPSPTEPNPAVPTITTPTPSTTATCECGWQSCRSSPSELSQHSPSGGSPARRKSSVASTKLSSSPPSSSSVGSPERTRTGSWGMRRYSLLSASGSSRSERRGSVASGAAA